MLLLYSSGRYDPVRTDSFVIIRSKGCNTVDSHDILL